MGNIEKGEEKTERHKTVVCTIINICVGEYLKAVASWDKMKYCKKCTKNAENSLVHISCQL